MKISNFVVLGAMVALVVAPMTAEAQRGQGGGGQGRGQGGFGGGFGQRGGFGMGGNNSLQLVQRADVQADLKLTAEQKAELTKLQTAQQEAMRARMEEMRNGGGGGGGFDMEAMRAEMEKVQKEQEAAVNKVLSTEQQARLKQISFQMRGARALMDEAVQKELGLDRTQTRKIEDLQTAQQEANGQVMQRVRNGEIERTEVQAIMDKNNQILDQELLKVLNEEQTAKFKAMQGPEFKRDPKVDEAMRQGRGGRGGGGGN